MNSRHLFAAAACSAALLCACSQKPKLEISLSDKFEGKEVQLVNFLDSTVVASAVITDGKAVIERNDSAPFFGALMIDGRTRSFYIPESGTAFVNDSTNSAIGTPLNDRFAELLTTLDSIENLDDTPLYVEYVKEAYNKVRNTPLENYFAVEWIRYASPETIDSLLAVSSEPIKNSPKVAAYKKLSLLRAQTAPGQKFVDFEGETEHGKTVAFSQYINKEGYTIVDFWASWCPYCIKELPELKALQEKWTDKGVKIVGVAVRDVPDDTRASINKHNITWPVVFNTQRRPYDIYGISGIPHHILLDSDGVIVSRGENPTQIDARLESLLNSEAE